MGIRLSIALAAIGGGLIWDAFDSLAAGKTGFGVFTLVFGAVLCVWAEFRAESEAK